MTRTPSAAPRRFHPEPDSDLQSGQECLAEVVTVVRDSMQDRVLLRCRGAVALPTGSVVELGDGRIARVESVRLVAPSPRTAQVVIDVVPTPA